MKETYNVISHVDMGELYETRAEIMGLISIMGRPISVIFVRFNYNCLGEGVEIVVDEYEYNKKNCIIDLGEYGGSGGA